MGVRRMTKDEILKIKEHIEIHARREHRAIIITEILWKAVDELEHIKELKKENKQLKQQIEKMKCCFNCDKPIKHQDCGDCHNGSNWELAESDRLIRS